MPFRAHPTSRALKVASVLVLSAGCAAGRGGTTWEQDHKDGIITRRGTLNPPASHRAPRQPPRAAEDADAVAGDWDGLARELELTLIQFTSRRRALMEEPAGAGWPHSMLSLWGETLERVDEGLALPLGVLPKRLLIQSRVSLETELELTERKFGPPPDALRARVLSAYGRVALHMQRSRDAMSAPRPRARGGFELEWPLSPLVVTSPFGYRRDPILGESEVRFHAGVDLAGRHGELVAASAPGRVVDAGWLGGHGLTVTIQHAGGYVTMYAHLRRILVTHGAEVGTGAPVGLIGSSGRATGPHLHFEVRHGGVPLNPMDFLTGFGGALSLGDPMPNAAP